MDADRPETISYWSLDLRVRDPHPDRGDIRVDDSNVNDLILLAYHRWEWQAPKLYDLEPSRKGGAPVLPTLDATQVKTVVNLSLVGDKDIVVRGDRIVFRNSGLTAVVDQGEQLRVLTEPVDGTENVSLMATVAGISDQAARGARRSDDATPLPVAAHQPFERAGTIKRLRDFQSVQPIFYLEQAVGFVLLAEAFQSAEERRLIYTLRAVTDDSGQPVAAMYFWSVGLLSSFLDNAPTYLVFFELAGGDPQRLMTAQALTLAAISAGAVFMGANSYIGNAPNFMVKAIAEERGIQMPSFFGYMAWSGLILVPLFVLTTLVFFL